jgi:hypothetical protein
MGLESCYSHDGPGENASKASKKHHLPHSLTKSKQRRSNGDPDQRGDQHRFSPQAVGGTAPADHEEQLS